MGFLRLYLALCVVETHAGPTFFWPVQSGREAVQIFYIISGFYMALIAGNYKTAKEFYASRFLRIFIPFYTIASIVIVASIATGAITNNYLFLTPHLNYQSSNNGFGGFLFSTLSNVTVFFQDWVMFITHPSDGSLSFTSNFYSDDKPLHKYLLIPQAWTVGVELTFYIFVPVLSRLRNSALLILFFAALAFRIFIYEGLGWRHDPWIYRFFPCELALFLLGMITYRFYSSHKDKIPNFGKVASQGFSKWYGVILLLAFFMKIYVSALSRLMDRAYAELLAILPWAIIIMVIFHLFRGNKLDRAIGELSYPVYLSHLLVISICVLLIDRLGWTPIVLGPVSAILSVGLSVLLVSVIFSKFEEKRHLLASRFSSGTS